MRYRAVLHHASGDRAAQGLGENLDQIKVWAAASIAGNPKLRIKVYETCENLIAEWGAEDLKDVKVPHGL